MPYIEQDHKKYLLGIYRATVIDRDDDSSISDVPHRGRILCVVHYLEDKAQEEHPVWCDYCGPSHQFFSVPDVGTMVYVMFNGGNPEDPVWIGAVNTTKATKDPPQRFRRDTPDVSGYESLKGHFLEFDDIDGERHIRLEDLKGNYFLMDSELDDLEAFFANDERRTIGRDRLTNIGRDDTLNIGRDNVITIGNNQTQDVGNDQVETIGNDTTLDVGNDQTETIGNNRTQTVTADDDLTVSGNKVQGVAGTWDDTIVGAYSRVGQSTGSWEFQGTISFDTQMNFEMTVQSDWTADVTGNTEFTITGDYTAEVTGSIEFEATQDIVMEAAVQAQMKNTIFEMTMTAGAMTLGTPTSNVIITPTSVTITVGGTTQTWTSLGSVFSGTIYVLEGTDHITHTHDVFFEGQPTGPPN